MYKLPLQVFGLAGWEWIVIFFIIMLLFGSKKLPELARSMGKALAEFQRGKAEFDRELQAAVEAPTTTPTPPLPQKESPPEEKAASQEPPAAKEISESEKLLKLAQDLGIDVEGKTNEQLREEIKKALG